MNGFPEAEQFLREARFFPEEFDYALTVLKPVQHEVTGWRLMAVYTSASAGREARFYYSLETSVGREGFSMFIGNQENESVQVAEHLKRQGFSDFASSFHNESPKRTSKEFFAAFESAVMALAAKELSGLLSGKEWNVEPFEWLPYR